VTDVQAMVENHLKDMILKTFDPKKADTRTIFTEEGEVSLSACPKEVRVVCVCVCTCLRACPYICLHVCVPPSLHDLFK